MENLYETTVERYHKYVMPTYAPKILFVRGQGARLWDADGREYLDFAAGISVCNLGHCNPRVTAAIQKQAATLVHVSNLYMNEVMPRLAEKLITNCFDGVVFFANSGAEANEGMIKFARKIGNATGRNEIISMNNSFHGRTLATLAATGRAKYRKGFEPEVPGFKQVDFNDIDALKAAITDKTCAVLLEPVQGEGGTNYARSLLAGERGEWRYDTLWKKPHGWAKRAGWLGAVTRAQRRVGRGGIACPVLVLSSDSSLRDGDGWDDRYLRTDIVLSVTDIQRRGARLGSDVERATVRGGMHDLILSRRPARDSAYALLFDFLDRHTAGAAP